MDKIYPRKLNLIERLYLKAKMPNLKKFMEESKNERINSNKTITNN